ncbi:MAG: hypothetical protein ACI4HM_09475 [Ruminococcus sp.]|nr:hypothetical protein [Ruminococcus sp.]
MKDQDLFNNNETLGLLYGESYIEIFDEDDDEYCPFFIDDEI